jgi:hypothetical protein
VRPVLAPRCLELGDRTEAFTGEIADFPDGSLEPHELPPQIIDGGLQPIAHSAAPIGKEEVGRTGTNQRANRRP